MQAAHETTRVVQAPWAGRFSVGITGGIGSGKSTVADLLVARGAALIDTDAIAHALTAPQGAAMPAIAAAFGANMINQEGALNRANMRALVFSDPHAKLRLEAILHPLIGEHTRLAAAHAQGAYLLFAVPLLVESGKWYTRVNRVLVVDCDEPTQIARVIKRNPTAPTINGQGVPLIRAQVEAIIAVQASREERLAIADDVVNNYGDVAALLPQVEMLHAQYIAYAHSYNPSSF